MADGKRYAKLKMRDEYKKSIRRLRESGCNFAYGENGLAEVMNVDGYGPNWVEDAGHRQSRSLPELVLVKHIVSLEDVALLNIDVDLDGLQALAGLPNLRNLELIKCKMPSNCANELGRMSQLISLHLPGGSLTKDEVAALRSTLKGVLISDE